MRTLYRIVLLSLLLNAALAFGQVYSWRDANGKMHYSDTPPTDADVKQLNVPTGGANDAAAARKNWAEKDMEFRKRQAAGAEAEAKATKEKQQAEEKQANCTRAQNVLQGLQSGQIRFTTDASGGRVALDDEARAAEIARAQASVDSWCK